MIPAHFICRNHFYSFLSVQTRVQETRRPGPPESRRTLSRRNHFSSFLPGETGAKEPGDQARRDALHLFSREPVFLIPSGWDRSPGSQEIGLAGMHCTIFQGNHFSSFPLFHGRRWPHQTFSSSSSSSSSLQIDTGILAVRKTGASVLRLLPPTS